MGPGKPCSPYENPSWLRAGVLRDWPDTGYNDVRASIAEPAVCVPETWWHYADRTFPTAPRQLAASGVGSVPLGELDLLLFAACSANARTEKKRIPECPDGKKKSPNARTEPGPRSSSGNQKETHVNHAGIP